MKNEEDEAFDELAKRQGAWGGGFPAKRKMAADKLQEPTHCQCTACKDGVLHASDCAVHNGPAYPAGPCDCGVAQEQDWKTLPPKDAPLVQWAKEQTAPPQRTWVGLTDEEIDKTYWRREPFRRPTQFEFARDIEQLLKEKNNG